MNSRTLRRLLSTLAVAALLNACGSATEPSVAPSASSSGAAAPSATGSTSALSSALASASAAPSTSASASTSPSASASSSPSASPSPSASASRSASPSATASPSASVSPSASRSPSPSATIAPTETATETATEAATGEASGSVVVTPNADGTQLVENTAEGFTLTLPAGWETVDPTDPQVGDAVQQGLERGGFQDVPINLDALLASNVRLLAFDFEPDTNTGFATNMNVLQAGAGNATLDQIESEAEAQVEQGLNVDVTQQRVTLGDGEALQLRYTLDPPAEGVPSLETTQYIFGEDRGNYVLTFSTLPETQAAYAPIFEQIAASFALQQ